MSVESRPNWGFIITVSFCLAFWCVVVLALWWLL